ncbi:MAG: vWA domain-containing protein [Planctomycetota bacterium]
MLAASLGLTSSALADDVTIIIEKPVHPIAPLPVEPAPQTPPFEGVRPAVDLAILLDTSNSMDGLIDQARSQLWTIVSQFAAAKKAGQTPHLRVALFEYGNTRLPATEGYLRQVVPLTDDLDVVSEELFALTTNGGDEYCGQVIDEAITRLDWSEDPNAYRTIFIAGNEPFTQGNVDPAEACKRAIEHGVIVNTIHCGSYDAGLQGQWNMGARVAEGEYLNIDQDRVVIDIESPHDRIIIELNAKLNETYLWYGDEAAGYGANQLAQDANASSVGLGVALERAKTKASSAYNNRGRDLVDSFGGLPFGGEADAEGLAELEEDALPEAMKEMDADERWVFVQENAEKRAELQTQIAEATAKREAFVAEERKRLSEAGGDATLGDAVLQAIQKQLAAAGYEIESAE